MKLRIFTLIAIILSILRLSGQEIDPRDYIGEDISRYPYQLRNKIERAFLSETGERFTGSQYDPRSPNYAFERRKRKTTISDLDGNLDSIRDNMYRGGLTPFQRLMQEGLSRTPGTGVTGQLPTYIQQEIDDENLARREREVNLRIKKSQLNQIERYNVENIQSDILVRDKRASGEDFAATPAPVQPMVAKTARAVSPAPTAAAPAAEKPSASNQSYVVAKGDNLYSIAKKFKITQEALMKANNIDDPRKLKIGQKLAIP